MNRCAIILPYYGKFPNYFQLFLNSCAANDDFDWLIFTDDRTQYDYPVNVHVRYETFADMQTRVRDAFDFHPVIEQPYKLCDLKPMYGYLFEQYLAGYEFWGHCDCDLIFGDLSKFITDELLSTYDKIFPVGHLSLYRNTEENNRRFMLELDGRLIYREVLTSSRGYTFDESYLSTNINRIYQTHGFPIYMRDHSGNTVAKSDTFRITRYDTELGTFLSEPEMRAIYVWDQGSITRSFMRLGTFMQQELMYMHFQRRDMRVAYPTSPRQSVRYQIMPGSFRPLPVESVTEQNFRSIAWKDEKDVWKHRVNIGVGEVRFWEKRILGKLLERRHCEH